MKKLKISIILLIGLFQATFGQITEKENQLKLQVTDTAQGWKKGGVFAVNLAQASFANWAAGGLNSVAVNGLFSLFANYKKGKDVWDNSLDVGYGILKQGQNAHFMKTDDKIDFLTKYGRRAYGNFYYAALLNFKTQMAAGYNYPNDSVKISNFLAPAYLLVAIGMDYRPNGYLSIFLAPVAGKITIVNDQTLADEGAFGVEAATLDDAGNVLHHGKKSKDELGSYLRIIYSRNDFKNELLKNVSFTTKMDFFSNYLKNPQNIDVGWETLIVFKVNKYISANFNTLLLYDDDTKIIDKKSDGSIVKTGPRIQLKEILGVGFSYKFN